MRSFTVRWFFLHQPARPVGLAHAAQAAAARYVIDVLADIGWQIFGLTIGHGTVPRSDALECEAPRLASDGHPFIMGKAMETKNIDLCRIDAGRLTFYPFVGTGEKICRLTSAVVARLALNARVKRDL